MHVVLFRIQTSVVALSSGQQRKTLLSLRRPRTAVTELVRYSSFYMQSMYSTHICMLGLDGEMWSRNHPVR